MTFEFGGEVSLLIDLSEFVQKVDSWNSDLVELKCSIINSVESNLMSHINDGYAWHLLHVIISNSYKDSSHTLVLALNNGLPKDNRIIGVSKSIGDPVLLTHHCWGVDYEFLCFIVVGDGGFHLNGVVAVSKFSEAETTNDLTAINHVEVLFVSLSMESSH